MSLDLSPAAALAMDDSYAGGSGFSFLYPLQIIQTNDSSLVGDGTLYPCELTLNELINITFVTKSMTFTCSPGSLGSKTVLAGTFNYLSSTNVVSASAPYELTSWYTGSLSGYASALSTRTGREVQINRGLNVSWSMKQDGFEIDYLCDSMGENPTVYLYSGLFYPLLTAKFAQVGATLVSFRVPGGSGLICDSNNSRYTLYSGYVTFCGKAIKIGDLAFPSAGSPPQNKNSDTMSAAVSTSFNQFGV